MNREKNYSNRELDSKFKEVLYAVKTQGENHDYKLNAILEQTKKTNGRVSTLETEQESIKIREAEHRGEMRWIKIIGVPLALYILYQLVGLAFKL